MTDIETALKKSLDIVEKKMDFNNEDNNDQSMVELYGLLGNALTSVYIRNKLEKRMRDFDISKDKKLIDAIWEDAICGIAQSST
jgi:hypothetical protein